MSYYQILQRTPFPDKFENIPEWQLQAAEFDLKINKAHYYEHAVRKGGSILYPLEIAKRIVSYWEKRWEFASYQLKEIRPNRPDRRKDHHEREKERPRSKRHILH